MAVELWFAPLLLAHKHYTPDSYRVSDLLMINTPKANRGFRFSQITPNQLIDEYIAGTRARGYSLCNFAAVQLRCSLRRKCHLATKAMEVFGKLVDSHL